MLAVPELADFDGSDFKAIALAFQHVPVLDFRQAWRPGPDANFREGRVRLGRSGGTLLIFAQLADDHLCSRATGDHQRLWELGDVFEIFLRNAAREDYVELHVTPFGHRLQLRYASAQAFEELRHSGDFLSCVIREPAFDCAVRADSSGWEVFARVPLAILGPGPVHEALASFSRYDYGPEGRPVLSSTSAHSRPHFHRQQEWTRLALVSPGNS